MSSYVSGHKSPVSLAKYFLKKKKQLLKIELGA